MNNQSPFLDVRSFSTEDENQSVVSSETSFSSFSPFLSRYESEEGGFVDPEAEEYAAFLNELYDTEFDEALSALVSEATAIYETQFPYEQESPTAVGYQAERLLTQHFAPLVAEVESRLEALAKELSQRDPNMLTEDEIETIVDRFQPSGDLAPNFEDFFGKIWKGVKKVAKKAVGLAKKGISLAAKIGLGPVLNKLKALIKPLLKRVIQYAIGRLPMPLQPVARKLAQKLPFLKESEEEFGISPEIFAASGVASIQHEFNQQVATLLFAPTETEQDLEVAHIEAERQGSETYPLMEMDQARDQLVERLQQMKEGEDPSPHVENFIPAILPALKLGIRLIGRKRVVNFLAGLLGKLISRFVGPQYATPLSSAVVDAGLRLLQLEATQEEANRVAAAQVAAVVEETVQRIAAAPEYVLEDMELLEGFALEAFEQAAAGNLPPILPEGTYRQRPDLAENRRLGGIWMMMPFGRRKRRRFKKFSRTIPVRMHPHKVAGLETFESMTLGEVLEEQLGIASGEDFDAVVHLYEAIPGTRLSDITRQDEASNRSGEVPGFHQLHPLTREAAGVLLGTPEAGRDLAPHQTFDPHSVIPGQRFYLLEAPGKRPLTVPGPAGRTQVRRASRLKAILDFPQNEIRLYLFLSEVRAQEIAVKLRQRGHIGVIVGRLQRFLDRGLRTALSGSFGRLKIIHEAVTPDKWLGALQRLPSFVAQVLHNRLTQWATKGLADHLRTRSEEFIKAAEDAADGVTLIITLSSPPGFTQLRQALKGKGLSLSGLKLSGKDPAVKIKAVLGYAHE